MVTPVIINSKQPESLYEAAKVAAYVPEIHATKAQAEVLGLYRECYSQIVRDDAIQLHLMLMPGMKGSHLVYTAAHDEDVAQGVADLTGSDVEEMDMIVVLGAGMLEGDHTEDEMLEIVLGDVAAHLNRLWPIADRTAGRMGRHIGWAAIAGVIAGAHGVLRLLEPEKALIERIQETAGKGIWSEMKEMSGNDARQAFLQFGPAKEAVHGICGRAYDTYGDYVSLPATGQSLVDAAKTIFFEIVDQMTQAPKPII